MGSWRASENIPDRATGVTQDGAASTGNVTSTPLPEGLVNSPCGTTIPRTLIAIATLTVACAVLIIGWLVFFGVGVLPRLRAYRPGNGRVPYTFWSIFTPFVAFSTFVGLVTLAAAAVCLYSLSITRI